LAIYPAGQDKSFRCTKQKLTSGEEKREGEREREDDRNR